MPPTTWRSSSSSQAPPIWRDTRLSDLLPFGSPVLALVEQARDRLAAVNEYRVDISNPRIGVDKVVDVYAGPVQDRTGEVVVMLHERSIADKMDRQLTHRDSARSVTGLASMLGHEVKNPLSGIRGRCPVAGKLGVRRGPRPDAIDH